MIRRDFLTLSAVSTAVLLAPKLANQACAEDSFSQKVIACKEWSNGVPPLFCTAYIDPTLPPQKGQEATVAKYPLALVPQDNRPEFKFWRDRVRKINPSIKLLAYQMLIEETTVPGPGHDIMRKVADEDVWATYPGGFVPTVQWGNHIYRMHDPRSEIWQEAFLSACETTYKSYSYDGLFLDNCTIYPRATLIPSVREEMLTALNNTLIKLRKLIPNALIIGNSSYHFSALNGSLNEGRPKELAKEAGQRNGQQPTWNLHQITFKSGMPSEQTLKSAFEWSIENRSFFGASTPDYQHAIWPPLFEETVRIFNSYSPSSPLLKSIT